MQLLAIVIKQQFNNFDVTHTFQYCTISERDHILKLIEKWSDMIYKIGFDVSVKNKMLI